VIFDEQFGKQIEFASRGKTRFACGGVAQEDIRNPLRAIIVRATAIVVLGPARTWKRFI
jgi:hypothetical protein